MRQGETAMNTRNATLVAFAALALTLAAGSASAQAGFVSFNSGGFGLGLNFGAPAHVHANCCTQRAPSRYDVVRTRVWQPGSLRRVWVGSRISFGRRCGSRGFRRGGYYRTYRTPGRWVYVNRRVFVASGVRYTCGY